VWSSADALAGGGIPPTAVLPGNATTHPPALYEPCQGGGCPIRCTAVPLPHQRDTLPESCARLCAQVGQGASHVVALWGSGTSRLDTLAHMQAASGSVGTSFTSPCRMAHGRLGYARAVVLVMCRVGESTLQKTRPATERTRVLGLRS